MALAWPALRAAAKSVQASGDYSVLTPGMLALLLAGYVYINGVSGWATVGITRNRTTIWIALAPIVAYAMYVHLHVLWKTLPPWYNLGVVLSIYPFGFLGSLLVPKQEPRAYSKR